MPPDERTPATLLDMLRAAQLVVEWVQGRTHEDLVRDVFLRSAVERQVQIIGEAARRLDVAFLDAYPNIPWDKIIKSRHILVHDYDDLDYEVIWRIVTVHLPELIPQLDAILAPLLRNLPDAGGESGPPTP
jgi:uncharacterized protein with HEPN domain